MHWHVAGEVFAISDCLVCKKCLQGRYKTLLRYIHGISLGSMRLVFIELSCLQEKIANFHVVIDPHDLELQVIYELNQDTPEIHHGIGLDQMRKQCQNVNYAVTSSSSSS